MSRLEVEGVIPEAKKVMGDKVWHSSKYPV